MIEDNTAIDFPLRLFVRAFLEFGSIKRELYFYPEHLPGLEVPKGKVVRVTLDFVSKSKLENRPT